MTNVIPGRHGVPNPESSSINDLPIGLDSGFAAFAAPRNDVVRVA
jgi:hypothetical protein